MSGRICGSSRCPADQDALAAPKDDMSVGQASDNVHAELAAEMPGSEEEAIALNVHAWHLTAVVTRASL